MNDWAFQYLFTLGAILPSNFNLKSGTPGLTSSEDKNIKISTDSVENGKPKPIVGCRLRSNAKFLVEGEWFCVRCSRLSHSRFGWTPARSLVAPLTLVPCSITPRHPPIGQSPKYTIYAHFSLIFFFYKKNCSINTFFSVTEIPNVQLFKLFFLFWWAYFWLLHFDETSWEWFNVKLKVNYCW